MDKTLFRAALVAGATLALGACNEYYGGEVGYASDYPVYGGDVYAGGYDPAYDSFYGNPYGYRSVPYGYVGGGFGWYGDYYYPGTGYYVYDRGGRRQQWSSQQRSYWQQRARDGRDFAGGRRDDRRDYRDGRRDDRPAVANGQPVPPVYRGGGQWNGQGNRGDGRDRQGYVPNGLSDRHDYRQSRRGDRQQDRGGNRAMGVAAPAQGVAPQQQVQPRPDRPAFRPQEQPRVERQQGSDRQESRRDSGRRGENERPQ